jgi:hypothetical protein
MIGLGRRASPPSGFGCNRIWRKSRARFGPNRYGEPASMLRPVCRMQKAVPRRRPAARALDGLCVRRHRLPHRTLRVPRAPEARRGAVSVRAKKPDEPACAKRRRSYSPASGDPTFNTARKASCGISTRPTRFMRRLPSFCFSSSLRLRVISPP